MKGRKLYLLLAIIVAGVVGWAAFRPERLFINARVNESLPMAAANSMSSDTVLASGKFHDVAHKGLGVATIHQLSDGKRVLRFTNFETSNGPDVRVYLVAANDATDSDTVKKAGFVEVAPLKGNIGDQNYELPADLDLNKYHSVTIWCQRFGVNFATAPLNAGPQNGTPQAIATGSFHGVAHKGTGMASIYQLGDGQRVLRFTNFETSNGPDVRVYLVAATDATDSDTVKKAGFVEVAPLKGNIGDQNYELPADLDLSKYHSVTIWCQRFGVNFATAPLTSAGPSVAVNN